MRQRRLLTAAALLCATVGAHAEHFEFKVDLTGTYSLGGALGCFPPDFDQPACPQPGKLTALMSFDTPGHGDGSFLIEGDMGDITDFRVGLGWLSNESLFGGINVNAGVPNGSVQAFDETEMFTFDWATRSASYEYDYGYHAANGSFFGRLSVVPEPATFGLLLAGLASLAWMARRSRATARQR